jgi:hypothetical protein
LVQVDLVNLLGLETLELNLQHLVVLEILMVQLDLYLVVLGSQMDLVHLENLGTLVQNLQHLENLVHQVNLPDLVVLVVHLNLLFLGNQQRLLHLVHQ